jgi:hypothetical protein
VQADRGAGPSTGDTEIMAPPGVIDHAKAAAQHEAAKE